MSSLTYEESLQITIGDWCARVAPWDSDRAPFRYARIPNERPGSKAHRQIAKATGVVAGAADFVFWAAGDVALARQTFIIVFVEAKAPGASQSPAQRDFQRRCGAPYHVATTLEELIVVLAAEGLWKGLTP